MFEFDIRGVSVENYDEVDLYGKIVVIEMEVGEVVGEVVYEGDEDEEFESMCKIFFLVLGVYFGIKDISLKGFF